MIYIIIAACLIILLFIIYFIKRCRAIKKVKCTCLPEKYNNINALLEPFGFKFDLNDGIVISTNDVWQRELGYTNFYDIKAPFLNIVMNAEPIFFDYDCKHYRLELWKGQYGITTGAEMGLYLREINSDLPKNFYRAACDDERLNMGFILYKKCTLFSRYDLSWWLTGFDVGKFSWPKELSLNAYVELKNEEMTQAFVQGLLNAGYNPNQIEVCSNNVYFNFCEPRNYKLNHRLRIVKLIAQLFNRINCSLYMFFTRPFNKSLDKIAFITYMFPHLYKLIIRICLPRRKHKKNHHKKHHKH